MAGQTVEVALSGGTSGSASSVNGNAFPAAAVSGDVGKSFVITAAGTAALRLTGAVMSFFVAAIGSTFNADRWFSTTPSENAQTAVGVRFLVAPRAGVLRNFSIRYTVAGSVANNDVYVVQVNGVDTALTVTISETSTNRVSDTTHSVAVNQFDEIGIRFQRAGSTGTGPSVGVASVELDPA